MPSLRRVIYVTNAEILAGVFDSEAGAFLRALRQAGLRTDMIHFAIPGWSASADYRRKIEATREELGNGSLRVVESPPYARGLAAYSSRLRPALEQLFEEVPGQHLVHASGYLMSYSVLTAKSRWFPFLKAHADLRGVLPQEHLHYADHIWPRRVLEYFVARHMERRIVDGVDSLNCVSTPFRDYLIQRYTAKPEKVAVTPLCIDENLFYFDERTRRECRARLGWSDSVVLAYSGHRQKWQLPDQMMRNIRMLLERIPRARAALLSTKPEAFRDDLNALPSDVRPRCEIRSFPHAEVGRALMAADVGLLFRKNDLVNRVACPTKALEYLGSGLALLCTEGIGDISGLVREQKAGWVLPRADDSRTLEAVADSISRNAEGALSEEARSARSQWIHTHFSWKSWILPVLQRYRELAGERA
ncbi:MAG: glycosyltransferase [Candidatus Sumerlaeota bacterium]|nr:glycosyltransferase [Candidatus Sumerlaeota bacterium]